MDESNAMTIEFLRARLLSERAVSKSAKQRAEELAKRVAELEEQLKFVYLQRRKAEKAATDVLAILENHGTSNLSEGLNSYSDEEDSPCDFKVPNGLPMTKMETSSSSEMESPSLTGGSLSWSTNGTRTSLENKYSDSGRRRASFASTSLSARMVGKSCRRIRRRETRSTEESQNDCTKMAECGVDASDGSSIELVALRECPEYEKWKNLLESTESGPSTEEMESALQHQAQFIGQYEMEEKAQREWEDKFRQNNNSATQDSGDPGTHSDVTVDMYKTKPLAPSSPAAVTLHSDEVPNPTPKNLSCENRITTMDASESPSSNEQQRPSTAQTMGLDSNTNSPHLELALLPRPQPSSNLASVLESLRKARLSLSEKLHNEPTESLQIPFCTAGLFRLQSEPTNLPHVEPYFPHNPHLDQEMARPSLSKGPQSASSYSRTNDLDRSFKDPSYPFIPDIMLHVPVNKGALGQFPTTSGLPSVMRLSPCDRDFRRNMYQ